MKTNLPDLFRLVGDEVTSRRLGERETTPHVAAYNLRIKLVSLFASIIVIVLCGTTANAHDPYEITSVAYVHSDRIELFIEMEFPAGMTLAGQKPVRDVAVLSQFETALPRLRELAGGFYQVTGGNNVLYPVSTNVELGVEDHIQFKVEYPATQFRPLRFVALGLGAEASENPYGTSLTVLDMVNQKVLGQTTLFAATPEAQFPPQSAEAIPAQAMIETKLVPTNTVSEHPTLLAHTNTIAPAPIPTRFPIRVDLVVIYGLIGAVVLTVFVSLRKRQR